MNEPAPELSRAELLLRYAKQPARKAVAAERRSPFKFLDSYDIADADIFFGRDNEIDELLRHFHSSGHVLIYGESGSGKSSLVQCGLRSRIPEADALFIPLRVHQAGLPSISLQISTHAIGALEEAAEIPSGAGLVVTLRAAREAASRPLVLFFDQFEELFIFHDNETRQRFADDLVAIQQAALNVKVIIGIRQDYLAHLSELEDTVEGLFDNRFWLRRMSRENAAHAVVQACTTCDVKIDDGVAKAVLQRLDPNGLGIELPYLQVAMDRLYRQALAENPTQPIITQQDAEALGDLANILGSFLVEEVAKLPSPDTGRQILKAFVTREATRRSLDRDAVAQESAGFGAAIPPDVLDHHLHQLASVRILREIAGTYELRHDALALTVSGWISEVEKELIEVRDNLVNRFKEYEARSQHEDALLDQGFLDYLAIYQGRLKALLNSNLHQYIQDSQRHVQAAQRFRRRIRQLVTSAVSIIILGCLAFSLWRWFDAEQARKTAIRSAEFAAGREKDARASSELADVERKRADAREKDAIEAQRVAELRLIEMYGKAGLQADALGRPSEAVLWFAGAASLASAAPRIEEANRLRFQNWSRTFPTPVRAFSQPGPGYATLTMDFHADGTHLLVQARNDICTIWDLQSEKPIRLPCGNGPVRFALWNSTGDRWLVGPKHQDVECYSFPAGELLYKIPDSSTMSTAAMTSDGQLLALASDKLRIWDCHAEAFVGEEIAHPDAIEYIVFDPSGDKLATACADGVARIYATRNRVEPSRPLFPPVPNVPGLFTGGRVHPPTFIDRGRGLLTLSSSRRGHDDVVTWWDASSGEVVQEIHSAVMWVSGVLSSPDQRHFAVHGQNGAECWNIATRESIGVMPNGGLVDEAAFSPDGTALLTVSFDRTVSLWSALDGELLTDQLPHQYEVIRCKFSADGRHFATAQADNVIRVWRATHDNCFAEVVLQDNTYFPLSPDGRYTLPAGWNVSREMTETRVYEVSTGNPAGPNLEVGGLLNAGCFSPTRQHVVTASSRDQSLVESQSDVDLQLQQPGWLRFWDWRTGRQLYEPTPTPSEPVGIAFSPDGRLVVAVCAVGEILVVDATTGAIVDQLDQQDVYVTQRANQFKVTFFPGGKRFATWLNTNVRVWDTQTRTLAYTLPHESVCHDLTFSDDREFLATTSQDKTASVWHASSGKRAAPPLQHPDWVLSSKFSPDGTRLFTACRDKMARVWEWQSGILACPPLPSQEPVIEAHFAAGGDYLFTSALSQPVRFWDGGGKPITPPLKTPGRFGAGFFADLTSDGNYAVVAGSGDLLRIFDVRHWTTLEDPKLDLESLQQLGELNSGHQLHAGDDVVNLTSDEWLQRWQTFRERHPGVPTLVATSAERRAWHRRQTNRWEASHYEINWYAIVFHLNRLIEIDPALPELYRRRGLALARLQQWNKAEADLTTAVKLTEQRLEAEPEDALVQEQLGVLYNEFVKLRLDMGDFSAAEEFHQKRTAALRRRADADPHNAQARRTWESAAQRVDFAIAAYHSQLYHGAMNVFEEAMNRDASLADNLDIGVRYNAACCASLASSGAGDGQQLTPDQRTQLRKKALFWLRENLAAWTSRLATATPPERAAILETLEHWQRDSDLNGVRDSDHIATLPEDEQQKLTQLWDDVAALRTKKTDDT